MAWYCKLIAQQPYLVIISVAVFSVACTIVSLTTRHIPDFEDPTLVLYLNDRFYYKDRYLIMHIIKGF